jgi:DNA replication protein DnaC
VPLLLIIDDLGMRKLPLTAAEELLEIITRRYERASAILTSNRPVEDWGKLLGDAAAVSACSTACGTTDICSSAVRGAGEPSWMPRNNSPARRPRCNMRAHRGVQLTCP